MKPTLVWIVKLSAGLGIVLWFGKTYQWNEVIKLLATVKPGSLLLSTVLIFLSIFVAIIRWNILISPLSGTSSPLRLLTVLVLNSFFFPLRLHY